MLSQAFSLAIILSAKTTNQLTRIIVLAVLFIFNLLNKTLIQINTAFWIKINQTVNFLQKVRYFNAFLLTALSIAL